MGTEVRRSESHPRLHKGQPGMHETLSYREARGRRGGTHMGLGEFAELYGKVSDWLC